MSSCMLTGQGVPTAMGVVHVVDDQPDIRETASRLIRTIGLQAVPHADGAAFLRDYEPELPGCVVLDIAMPGMSGLEVHAALSEFAVPPPVIFVTGHAEVPTAVQALKAGAIDYLIKPFCTKTFLERVAEAVRCDLNNRRLFAESSFANSQLERLTSREREIAILLAQGESAKHIAHLLGISAKTVENHRTRILEKLNVDNPTQLAHRLARHPALAASGMTPGLV